MGIRVEIQIPGLQDAGGYRRTLGVVVLPKDMLGGIQLLSIGVLGEYEAKICLETKSRPRCLLEDAVGIDADARCR